MTKRTKVSLNKDVNRRLSVIATQLGFKKSVMLSKLSFVPVSVLRTAIKNAEKSTESTDLPIENTSDHGTTSVEG